MKYIDYFLDRITMYRLLLYYLIALLVIAESLSAFGAINYQVWSIAVSAAYVTLVCWITNKVFAYILKVPVNVESVYITALILALIITPVRDSHGLLFLTAAGGLAIASKFILTIKNKHIFNPAAIAVVLTAAGPGQSAIWWIGNIYLLPFVIIGGILILRKIRRFTMVISFISAVLLSSISVNMLLASHHDLWPILKNTFLHSSIFFLAFVMLTEPLTSPPTKVKQIWYGLLAGSLFPPQVHIFNTYSTPELSLVAANIFSYIVSPKYKLMPKLIKKQAMGPSSLDFVFKTDQPISYRPGQYMEWTLPHKNPDSRGNRRYFTLASSPTEKEIMLGVKFYEKGSSFKKAMLGMDSSTQISAGQLGGDFTLPDDTSKKLAFIAGGIGITPFRSMVKYVIDSRQKRDIILLYSAISPEEFAYMDVFSDAARKFGLKVIQTIAGSRDIPPSWSGHRGFIDSRLITQQVPDFAERTFYISGTHNLVITMKGALREIGVPVHQIKTDFFPGYV